MSRLVVFEIDSDFLKLFAVFILLLDVTKTVENIYRIGTTYRLIDYVRRISRSAFREFWENPKFADSEIPLRDLATIVDKAAWNNFGDLRTTAAASVSQISSERYVFNIGGNEYRVVLVIKFRYQMAYVRFVGTHQQYDAIDVETI